MRFMRKSYHKRFTSVIVLCAVIVIFGIGLVGARELSKKANPKSPRVSPLPSTYQIADVPYYAWKNFCYAGSVMMVLRFNGLSDNQVQGFKQILQTKGRGGPPDTFIGLRSLELLNKVHLAYSKNYNQQFERFYQQEFGVPGSQIDYLAGTDEALAYLKRLVSSNIPVIALIQKGNHYVVVTGYDGNYIYISDPDPDYGQRKIAIADFLNEWQEYRQDLKGDQIGFPGEYGMIWLEK